MNLEENIFGSCPRRCSFGPQSSNYFNTNIIAVQVCRIGLYTIVCNNIRCT